MKILFIVPLPPPIHGQSFVSKVLFDEMKRTHDITVINTSKEKTENVLSNFKRFTEVVKILYEIWKNRRNKDAVYITISESFLGNMKDLLTYLFFTTNLSKIIIHIHGGSLKKELWNKYPLIYHINKFFIQRIGGVIISGNSHKEIFSDIINKIKLYIIPNFAPDKMFITEQKLMEKFLNFAPLKILYVSGMRDKKGYLDLFQSFVNIDDKLKDKLSIDFAGAFESNEEREKFIGLISSFKQIKYHGVINENEKKKLFSEAHVFCLPTKYFEGQPISILEAYASGCLVLTTLLGGIPDIFKEDINGYKILPNDANSISNEIMHCLNNPNEIKRIGIENRKIANNIYKEDVFTASVIKIFEKNNIKK
jgi:glycosyltransferase involved in cell wall biosynthesis